MAAAVDICERPEKGNVGEGHLRRAVRRRSQAAVRPHDFDIGPADGRQFHLIVGPGDELGEGADKRDFARSGQAHRRRDHVLFGDLPFKEPLGMLDSEYLRECGIADIAVKSHNTIVECAQRGERRAVGPASGQLAFI